MQNVPALVDHRVQKHARLARLSKASSRFSYWPRHACNCEPALLLNPPRSCPDLGRLFSQHRTHSIAFACPCQNLWPATFPVSQVCRDYSLSSSPRRYLRHQHRLSAALYVQLPASKQLPPRQANPLSSRVMIWKDFEILLKWLQSNKISLGCKLSAE
jgi:hypothetical protein